ncbi:MAG: flagellar basal body P-ring formation chaperone FlgA [Candidatus Binatia bacterium]
MNSPYGFTYGRPREIVASVGRWLLALLLGLALSVQADGSQTQPLDSGAVEAVLLRHMRQAEPRRLENLELRVLPFQPVLLPAGVARLRVVQSARGGIGVQSFLIVADVGAKEEARFWVKAEVRVYDQVVVAARPIGRQESLSAKDLRLERREITSRTAQFFTRLDDVVGKQSTRSIQSDDVITANAIERPTLLKRGSPITLVFDSGSLRVETQGVAEEGGRMGDLIQVKNFTSGKMLRGVVLNERNVKVN